MHTAHFCQSCGMPLEAPQDFGTAADGSRVDDYCQFCFQQGAFTEPDITAPAMIDKCIALMTRQGVMAEAQARTLMTDLVPRLKRWRELSAAPTFRKEDGHDSSNC